MFKIEFRVFSCLPFVRNPSIFLKNFFLRLQFLVFPLPAFRGRIHRVGPSDFFLRKKIKIYKASWGGPQEIATTLIALWNPWGISVLRVRVSMLDTAIPNEFQTKLQDILHGDVEDRWFPQEKGNRRFALWLPIALGFQNAKKRLRFFTSALICMVFKNRHQKFSFWKLFLRFQLLTFLWKIFLRFFSNFSFSHFALFPKIFLFLKTKNFFLILPFIKTRHTALVISFQEVLKSAQFSHVRLPKPRL